MLLPDYIQTHIFNKVRGGYVEREGMGRNRKKEEGWEEEKRERSGKGRERESKEREGKRKVKEQQNGTRQEGRIT